MEQFTFRGWNHICFASDDVDATVANLASRGVPVVLPPSDFPEGPGVRIGIVQDLEGNMIEFTGPLSRSD
jgi:predicted enzyme related to lactoylglutathione lyase